MIPRGYTSTRIWRLAQTRPITQIEVQEELAISRSRAAALLQMLERQGLIKRIEKIKRIKKVIVYVATIPTEGN